MGNKEHQKRIIIVSTAWNQDFVRPTVDGCIAHLKEKAWGNVLEMKVPGHMELLAGARAALKKHSPAAIVVIGVVIAGETDTATIQANAVMSSLTDLSGAQD